jgi:hypothetical protein
MTIGRIFAGVVLVLPMAAALAIDLPPWKEGLWEIRTQTTSNPGNKKSDGTVKLCRDHAYDKAAEDLLKKMKECTITWDAAGAGKFVSASRCTVNGTVIVSKGTSSYQSTSVHTETHTTYTPAFFGTIDETTIQDQAYVSSCPAGMKPGDRISSDGTMQPHGK